MRCVAICIALRREVAHVVDPQRVHRFQHTRGHGGAGTIASDPLLHRAAVRAAAGPCRGRRCAERPRPHRRGVLGQALPSGAGTRRGAATRADGQQLLPARGLVVHAHRQNGVAPLGRDTAGKHQRPTALTSLRPLGYP